MIDLKKKKNSSLLMVISHSGAVERELIIAKPMYLEKLFDNPILIML